MATSSRRVLRYENIPLSYKVMSHNMSLRNTKAIQLTYAVLVRTLVTLTQDRN